MFSHRNVGYNMQEREGEMVVMTWVEGMQDIHWEDCEVALMSLLKKREVWDYQVMCSCEHLQSLAEGLCAKTTASALRPTLPLCQIWARQAPVPLFIFVSPQEFSTLNLAADVFLAVKTRHEEVSYFTVDAYIRHCDDMGLSSFKLPAPPVEESLFSLTASFRILAKPRTQPPSQPLDREEQGRQLEKKRKSSIPQQIEELKVGSENTAWPVEIGLYRDLDRGPQKQFYVVLRLAYARDWRQVRLCIKQSSSKFIPMLLGADFTFMPVNIYPNQPLKLVVSSATSDTSLSQEVSYSSSSLLAIPMVEAGTSVKEFADEQKRLREDLAKCGNNVETWKAVKATQQLTI